MEMLGEYQLCANCFMKCGVVLDPWLINLKTPTRNGGQRADHSAMAYPSLKMRELLHGLEWGFKPMTYESQDTHPQRWPAWWSFSHGLSFPQDGLVRAERYRTPVRNARRSNQKDSLLGCIHLIWHWCIYIIGMEEAYDNRVLAAG